MENVVAIDGPGGAGKTTIAKLLAKRLGYLHLNTGSMYRAVTFEAINQNIDFNNIDKLIQIAEQAQIDFNKNGDICLNNKNINEKIRTKKINKYVSKVAAIKKVREILVDKQRELAKEKKVVMDGRDITTVVLPKAENKFFLTASLEIRAKRRYKELKSKGKSPNFDEIKTSIAKRDKLDKEREHSPLKKADDAILIDTSNLTIAEVLEKLLSKIKGELN